MKTKLFMLGMFLTTVISYGQKSEDSNSSEYEVVEEAIAKIDNVQASEAKYTFFNGLNFDFTENDKTKYVGHFNVYVPANDHNEWGINTGILKISYKPNDSLVNTQIDKVLNNPLDIINGSGDTYKKLFNKYSSQTKVSTYSLYAQPMYRIIKDLGKAQIYFHAHLELLTSKYETNTKIETLQSEDVTILDGDPIPTNDELRPFLTKEMSKKTTLSTGNFGGGITIDFNFTDNCVLFMQPTVGISLNHANNFPTIDNEGNFSITASNKSQGFYLVRTYFQYFISKASQIILGTDIRGYFPKQTPYTSIYVGLNLGLDKIFNMQN